MKRRGALRLAGAAGAWLVLAPAARAASKPTPEQVIHNLGFAQSDVGYILFDVQSKRVLSERNADQLFLPASVSKLATVYAALEILGPITASPPRSIAAAAISICGAAAIPRWPAPIFRPWRASSGPRPWRM